MVSRLSGHSAECCPPVWCRRAHIPLTDSALNNALLIITGCLHPTQMDRLPLLSGIHPAELCRSWATLSLTKRGILDPDHILRGQLDGSLDVYQERQKSIRPFMSAARKLLSDLSKLGIYLALKTNYRWSTG